VEEFVQIDYFKVPITKKFNLITEKESYGGCVYVSHDVYILIVDYQLVLGEYRQAQILVEDIKSIEYSK